MKRFLILVLVLSLFTSCNLTRTNPFDYYTDPVDVPTSNYSSGTYDSFNLSLTTSDSKGIIYYALGNVQPNQADLTLWNEYSNPIKIESSTNVYCFVFVDNFHFSEVESFNFTVK